jgi:tryptophan 2,3-dioxygenase
MTGPADSDGIDGAETDFRGRMAYGDYLHLERILDAQTPLSTSPDELLFIIQHQTSELWMKLAIHEISGAMEAIRADDVRPAFKMLTRVARIFEQLNNAWDVLRTMTPSEYTRFRGALGQSSGFQSWQYRAIEFLAGNRNLAMLKPHAHRPETVERLEASMPGRSATGRSTSWPRSWSISRTISAAGASTTSPRSSASSG